MLAVLDYGAGNLASVVRSLNWLGIPVSVTDDASELRRAEGVIFPGVGQAAQAMARLREKKLDSVLRELVGSGRPLLGICLGCQIMLERSAENQTKTLGIVPGECLRLESGMHDAEGLPLAIPHMGWNSLRIIRPSPLLENVDPAAEFYFVHSFYVCPDPGQVIAVTEYGHEFCSVYGHDGFWATQFHPEKSGEPGLMILRNFYSYCHAV